MYAPGYGFPNAVPPTFNTAAPPQTQNPHMQPGSVPAQPGQQMMYNPQQFAAMAGAPQGSFVAGPNAGAVMMPGAGPAGMMQNTAMPHMVANGQSTLFLVLPFLDCCVRSSTGCPCSLSRRRSSPDSSILLCGSA
jgi:hypothetical protein